MCSENDDDSGRKSGSESEDGESCPALFSDHGNPYPKKLEEYEERERRRQPTDGSKPDLNLRSEGCCEKPKLQCKSLFASNRAAFFGVVISTATFVASTAMTVSAIESDAASSKDPLADPGVINGLLVMGFSVGLLAFTVCARLALRSKCCTGDEASPPSETTRLAV